MYLWWKMWMCSCTHSRRHNICTHFHDILWTLQVWKKVSIEAILQNYRWLASHPILLKVQLTVPSLMNRCQIIKTSISNSTLVYRGFLHHPNDFVTQRWHKVSAMSQRMVLALRTPDRSDHMIAFTVCHCSSSDNVRYVLTFADIEW